MNKLDHIAFIMDGNGRWGKKRKRTRNFGHIQGVKTVKKIVEISLKMKIPIITFYVFSTENWKRPRSEINFLFNLIKTYFTKEIKNVIKNGIKINIIGNTENLPIPVNKILKNTILKTKKNKNLIVNLAINYGSRDEIVKSTNKIIKQKNKVSTTTIKRNLYTSSIKDPDILVRTGGHKRLSNFMLWQLAYTELYFLDKLWPDFQENDLKKIIKNYKKIKRNFGGI